MHRLRWWLSEKLYELGSWIEPGYHGPDFSELMDEHMAKYGDEVLQQIAEHNALLNRK
jgi:hypothetical protein